MPHDRDEWISRIKGIEREHQSIRFAVQSLVSAAGRDPTVLQGSFRLRELQRASEHLDGTYGIRLFSAFESGLRSFWGTLKKSNPQVRSLLESIAARRSIPQDTLINTHAIREYRNSLVHESTHSIVALSITAVRHHLCTYFSYLPRKW